VEGEEEWGKRLRTLLAGKVVVVVVVVVVKAAIRLQYSVRGTAPYFSTSSYPCNRP
jgi:hypothetical protein